MVYQVFPDRFARSAAADEREVPDWALAADWDDEVVFEGGDPRTPMQLFGGDLDGITEHLDHVAEVGADVVYTTPVFPGESNHRYNATTFTSVDPLLGGDEAYARLSTAVHARGWRILGDLTTNHTGDTHEWFLSAVDGASTTRTARSTTSRTTAPTPAGWATARCRRSTTPTSTCGTRWSRARTRWSAAGCARRTTSTAGASTSPT